MENTIKIKRTSRRWYQVGKMFFTKENAEAIEQETNEILNSIK
jgi:hypothetical protein